VTVPALQEPAGPKRSDVVALLATFGDRRPEQVPEAIDSMELAWLIYQLEQRYGALDIDDDLLTRMTTVTGVVGVLTDLRIGASHD
jgi:hypothetical protein